LFSGTFRPLVAPVKIFFFIEFSLRKLLIIAESRRTGSACHILLRLQLFESSLLDHVNPGFGGLLSQATRAQSHTSLLARTHPDLP
jgi:hypothetical protein